MALASLVKSGAHNQLEHALPHKTPLSTISAMDSDQSQKQWASQKLASQLLATMVSNVFYGIAMCMAFQYFLFHGRRDRLKTKTLVSLLSVSITLEVVFDNIQIFDMLVLSFQDFDPADSESVTIPFTVLGKYVTVFLTSFMAQLFYATRLWSIGRHIGRKSKLLAIPVALLSSTQLGAGLTQVDLMRVSVTYVILADKIKALRVIVAIQGSATTTCDLVVTSSISYILHTSRTGIRRTDSLLEKIIRFAIQWAAATSICSVLTIILFYYSAGDVFFNLTWLIGAHLHVMSVISVLISREGLREHIDRSFHVSDMSLRTIVPESENTDVDSWVVHGGGKDFRFITFFKGKKL
ncbi:hypothetical protein BDQ17DRAFT_1407047 [Cyathus striatus]|nr:hypothetical protein BDQ17DRAFT_1407047 [Cyathus striatus]